MIINEKLKSLSETRKQLTNLKNQINKQSYEIFTEFRKEIFDKYPKLESFGWTQYTPYFNDGETCVFSPNTSYIKINGEYAEDTDWISNVKVINWGTWNPTTRKYEDREEIVNESYDEDLSNAHDEIINFLSYFDDDFYLSQFGDHAEIVVNKDGFTVEDCDHD